MTLFGPSRTITVEPIEARDEAPVRAKAVGREASADGEIARPDPRRASRRREIGWGSGGRRSSADRPPPAASAAGR